MDPLVPDADAAAAIAETATGRKVLGLSRFTTGAQHYVFEALFADGTPVVVRMSRAADVVIALGASGLSKRLRPLGVPLPAIIAEGFEPPFPFMVLERLPGTDLGRVVGRLSEPQLHAVAGKIAAAQAIVAVTPSAGRYGYAVTPETAPRERWSAVLDDSIARSRSRIVAVGLLDPSVAEAAQGLLAARRDEADAQPAVPFLHDATVKNVIVTEAGGFSGIVDVDDLCFGDPRWVVALTRGDHGVRWQCRLRRRLDAYRRPPGRPAVPALCGAVPVGFHGGAGAGVQRQPAGVDDRGAKAAAWAVRGGGAAGGRMKGAVQARGRVLGARDLVVRRAHHEVTTRRPR